MMTAIPLQRPLLDRFAAPIYLLLLTMAEVLTTYAPPAMGVGFHSLLLLGLLAHIAYSHDAPLRALLLALCIAPLIRILSLGLPLVQLPQISWYLIVSVPLFASSVLLIRTLGYSRLQLGLRWGHPGWQLLVVLFGLVLGVTEYIILRPQPLIAALTWQQLVIPSLILLICTGFSEELIFRGVMQQAAYDAIGKWAIVYVAAVFAVLHIGYRSLIDFLFVFAVGVIFGLIVRRTGSLLGVTLAHGLTNILLFLVMPFVGLPALPAIELPRLTLPAISAPLPALPGWTIELVLLGLWAALLAAAALAASMGQRMRRRRGDAALQNDRLRRLGALVGRPVADLEGPAREAWQLLAPEYVLVVARNNQQSVVRLAIGASGRRLRGIEGLQAPWAAFAPLAPAGETPEVREIEQHPFSRHRGDYLVLPLADNHWLLVRAGQGRELAAHRTVASPA